MGLKLVFVLLIVMAVMSGGFYLYYKDTQKTIATLHENNAKLEVAVHGQKEAIKTMEISFNKQAHLVGELQTKLSDAEIGYKKLSSKLRRHNLEELSRVKPQLMENKINKGTKRIIQELEIISGTSQSISN